MKTPSSTFEVLHVGPLYSHPMFKGSVQCPCDHWHHVMNQSFSAQHSCYIYNTFTTIPSQKTYPRHSLFLLMSFIIHESKQGDSRSSFSNSNTKNHWWSGGQKPREGPLSLLISSTLTPSPYIVNGHPMSTIKNRRLISSRIDTGYNYLLCYWNSTLFQNSDDTTRWISLPQHLVKPLYTSQCISCNMTPRQHSPS